MLQIDTESEYIRHKPKPRPVLVAHCNCAKASCTHSGIVVSSARATYDMVPVKAVKGLCIHCGYAVFMREATLASTQARKEKDARPVVGEFINGDKIYLKYQRQSGELGYGTVDQKHLRRGKPNRRGIIWRNLTKEEEKLVTVWCEIITKT